jgi:hypothetical protein
MSECPVCHGATSGFATAMVLGRHEAHYRRCRDCGSVHVEEPHWLDEAYGDAIASTDIGLPSRAVRLADITAATVRLFLPGAHRFVDHGGGNGLFVRLMRDRGFDFRWRDPYADNVFARGHDAEPDGRFDLTTAFEVLEHLTDPHAGLEAVFASTGALLATTAVLPDPAPKPDEWWYYSLGTGQHVTFYSHRGLQALAAARGLTVTSGGEVHLFASTRIDRRLFRLAASGRAAHWMSRWSARSSLLESDYRALTGRSLTR